MEEESNFKQHKLRTSKLYIDIYDVSLFFIRHFSCYVADLIEILFAHASMHITQRSTDAGGSSQSPITGQQWVDAMQFVYLLTAINSVQGHQARRIVGSVYTESLHRASATGQPIIVCCLSSRCLFVCVTQHSHRQYKVSPSRSLDLSSTEDQLFPLSSTQTITWPWSQIQQAN